MLYQEKSGSHGVSERKKAEFFFDKDVLLCGAVA
jgi:hypothetical protein